MPICSWRRPSVWPSSWRNTGTVGPVENAGADWADTVVVGGVGVAGEGVCVVVAVEEAEPHVVPGRDSRNCIQPSVVDDESKFRTPDLLIRPEAEVAELNNPLTTVPSRELAQRADPVKVAVRVAGDEQTRRFTSWARHLLAASHFPTRVHSVEHDRRV